MRRHEVVMVLAAAAVLWTPAMTWPPLSTDAETLREGFGRPPRDSRRHRSRRRSVDSMTR